MKRRFQSIESGNWTLTSPISTTCRRLSAFDPFASSGSIRSSIVPYCSSRWKSTCDEDDRFFALRRPVRLDTRFISRCARDPPLPLSSDSDELSLIDRGIFARLVNDILLDESAVLSLGWVIDRYDEKENRPPFSCLVGLLGGSSGRPSRLKGGRTLSCSTMSGLLCRFKSPGAVEGGAGS
jgi:hypothetical protein